jgi:hypothetical protein
VQKDLKQDIKDLKAENDKWFEGIEKKLDLLISKK